MEITEEAVFFDLDRTLIAGSSAFEFARAAYRAGLLGRRQLLKDTVGNIRFRLRGATDEEMEALVERVGGMIAGVRVQDLTRLAPDILSGVLPRLYPRMLEVAYQHQDAGRDVYICTAASQEIAALLAEVLGFEGALATRNERLDGFYTGRLDGPFIYGEGKVVAITELAAVRGYDLDRCYAYSDSVSDLPMLEAVGNPVVVNPDPKLDKIAKQNGWQILRFEKLGQRLKLGSAILLTAAASGIGSALLTGHRPELKLPRLNQRELDGLLSRAKQLRPMLEDQYRLRAFGGRKQRGIFARLRR